MPRFDGSYPDLGIDYSTVDSLGRIAVPQTYSMFSDGSDGNLSGLTTTGSKSLDPSTYVDLIGDLTGGVTATIVDGFFGSNPNNPMGFTCPNLILRTSGSGIEATVQPNVGSGWWTEIQFLDSGSGYCARLESGLLSLCRVDSGTPVTLKSLVVGTNVDKLLSFTWDGNQKFRASWGSDYITEVDDTYDVMAYEMRVVSQGGKVSSFTGGVVKGSDFNAVDAPYRNACFANILYYDGISFPWVADSSTVFDTGLLDVTGANALPFITLAYCKPSLLSDATPAGAPGVSFVDDVVTDWVELLDDNSTLSHFIIWKDNYGMKCGSDSGSSYYDATPGCTLNHWDYPRYRALYEATYNALTSDASVSVYGPNCHLTARSEGFDADYGGVQIDSRDMDFLESFIDEVLAATPTLLADGIAVSGSFSLEEWEDLVPYLKSLCSPLPLIVTSPPLAATPTQDQADEYMLVMNDLLDEGDAAFYDYGSLFFHSPRLVFTEYDWTFTATLSIPSTMIDGRLKVVGISDKVLKNGAVTIISDAATPYQFADELPVGNEYLSLGDLEEGVYSITVFGDKGQNGNAMLRIGIYSDNFDALTLADTRYLGTSNE